jgi:hypothetical protein
LLFGPELIELGRTGLLVEDFVERYHQLDAYRRVTEILDDRQGHDQEIRHVPA